MNRVRRRPGPAPQKARRLWQRQRRSQAEGEREEDEADGTLGTHTHRLALVLVDKIMPRYAMVSRRTARGLSGLTAAAVSGWRSSSGDAAVGRTWFCRVLLRRYGCHAVISVRSVRSYPL